jgi:hypothetical protein
MTEARRYFEKILKGDLHVLTHPKVPGMISKIIVPPESLSQYLSNESQCYGVSIES